MDTCVRKYQQETPDKGPHPLMLILYHTGLSAHGYRVSRRLNRQGKGELKRNLWLTIVSLL